MILLLNVRREMRCWTRGIRENSNREMRLRNVFKLDTDEASLMPTHVKGKLFAKTQVLFYNYCFIITKLLGTFFSI